MSIWTNWIAGEVFWHYVIFLRRLKYETSLCNEWVLDFKVKMKKPQLTWLPSQIKPRNTSCKNWIYIHRPKPRVRYCGKIARPHSTDLNLYTKQMYHLGMARCKNRKSKKVITLIRTHQAMYFNPRKRNSERACRRYKKQKRHKS